MAFPTQLFGLELDCLTRQASHTETAEIRLVRTVAGYRRTDHIKSKAIRRVLNLFNSRDKIGLFAVTRMNEKHFINLLFCVSFAHIVCCRADYIIDPYSVLYLVKT